ncbi:MAG: hypothetical protein GY952_02100 [Rhodobacteraceae bacterium]|nr:hypothetical protein [Paracoccaceae bacterium]
MTRILLFLTLTMLSFTPLGYATEAEAAGLKLWTRGFASSGKCRAFSGKTGPEQFSKSVQGYSYPLPKGSGAEFIERTIRHLNSAAAGDANDKVLLARLLAAANSGAYTKLDFGAKGGSSPSFVTSVLVRTVAYAVSYLRTRNGISSTDLKTIDQWVRTLLKNSGVRASSIDHKASVAAAQISWGAATGNAGLFKSGKSKLNSVMGKIRSTPQFDNKVRVNTEVLPIVLMGAHMLRLNGIDIFPKKYGKYTLHDAVAHHAAWVSRTGSTKVKTEAISDTQARSILKSEGWGTHQAWIPLYLAHFPNSHAAASVRKLHKQVKRAQNIAYYGRNMGVHSACYFGL